MAKQSIAKRIEALEKSREKNPELEKLFDFYRAILLAQKQIEAHKGKGTKIDLSDRGLIQDLQSRANESRNPISSFLGSEIFLEDLLLATFLLVSDSFPELVREEMESFIAALKTGGISIVGLAVATLKEDPEYFVKCEKEYKINPKTLLLMTNSLVQPLLEEIARCVDRAFLEGWWEAKCPVCGKKPVVARIKNRKRYLICSLCGAEYLADLFLCVNCGNLDPSTMGFLAIDNKPWLRLDYCEKCKHYIKIIDNDKIKAPVTEGLEDLLTINLDRIAQDAGLLSWS